VLPDASAVVAAYSPLRAHFNGAAVAQPGPGRFGVGGGANNTFQQMGGAAGAAMAALGLLTDFMCLPVQTRPGAWAPVSSRALA
jgi:hypothetical protein